MARGKVDVVQAAKACEAVQSGAMSVRSAALAFGVSKSSIARRVNGEVAMDAKVGPKTVLTKEEEDSLEDIRCCTLLVPSCLRGDLSSRKV
ncbi:unnamed protein product [Hapterophycus canaliculatus]